MGTSRAHGPARPGEPGLSGFRIGLLVLVVATAAWRGFTSSRWSWFADDWVHLEGTQTTGFLAYLFEDHAGDHAARQPGEDRLAVRSGSLRM